MTTTLKLVLTNKSGPLVGATVQITGSQMPKVTDRTGVVTLECDGHFNAAAEKPSITVVISPDRGRPITVDLPVKANEMATIRADYGNILQEIEHEEHLEHAAHEGHATATLRQYGRSEWQKLASILTPILVLIIASIVGVWYYMTHTEDFTTHFSTLQTSGPEILGGLSMFVIVTMVINTVGSLLRGERGMLEDFWAPIMMVIVAVGSKPYITGRLDFVKANMATAPLETIFLEGGKAYGLILFFVGITAISMIRAVTYQRMERRLDFSPLDAALVVIGALAYYNSFGFSLSLVLWIVIVAVVVISMTWELKKNPIGALIGIGLGITIALMGSKTFTLVSLSIAALAVFGIGIYKFFMALDTKAQTPEFTKLMEAVPLEVLEYAWYIAFIACVTLAKFGSVPLP